MRFFYFILECSFSLLLSSPNIEAESYAKLEKSAIWNCPHRNIGALGETEPLSHDFNRTDMAVLLVRSATSNVRLSGKNVGLC